MIAADTSIWLDFAKGNETRLTAQLEVLLQQRQLVMPMPVLFEILSGPGLTIQGQALVVQIPQLEIYEGFWNRAAEMTLRLILASSAPAL